MQEQFKNIFVTLEVAKMAKEKGFVEWCAAYYSIRHELIYPNIDGFGNLLADCDNQQECIELPTHHQLIEWLRAKNIDVWRGWKEEHVVQKKGLEPSYLKNINDALLEALKLVNNG